VRNSTRFFLLILLIVIAIETAYILSGLGLVKPTTFVKKATPKPLLAYTFDNLRKTEFPKNQIALGEVVSENNDSVSRMFYFLVPKTPGSKIMEKVSGLANIPKKTGNYPIIVMFRGFVPDNIYKPGIGTQPVAGYLAKNGYITLAPDFLGYGQSSKAANDPFENRFQTYTTALTLLSSLSTLNNGLSASYSGTISADLGHVGIWGHSNGGHIALSTIEISGVTYPTVLWAPVSTSFPYSVLFYTDDSDDSGKGFRKTLADFEVNYNTDQFSLTNYFKWIKAPLEINQGTQDLAVPYWWSDNLVSILKKDNVSVNYLTYPGADHNMLPNGWTNAALDTLNFYNQNFSKK
jgi:dienelactone hydrolase